MWLRPWPCLVSGVMLILTCCIVPSKTYDVYYFCGNSSSNVVYINDTSSPVLIRSPNYGDGPYGNSQLCSMVLRSGGDPLILFLHYNFFDLERRYNCEWDALCVHGVKFCGNWTTGQTYAYILPLYNSFTFVFTTDSTGTATGFEITVTTEHASTQVIEEITGGVGSNESNVHTSTVAFQPGFSYRDRCVNTPTTPPMDTPTTTTETTTTHDVYYFCDNSSFKVVNISSASPQVLIRSPNYGAGPYGNDQQCSVVIRSGEEPLILFLHYNFFDLERQNDCAWDTLCVHGVKFCGNWTTGQTYAYILPMYNSFTLEFKTDGVVTKAGFEITVTTELASTQEIEEITGGVGSNESNVNTSTVAFGPGFSYRDRCVNTPTTPPVYTTPTTDPDAYYFCAEPSDNVVNINATSPPVLISSLQPFSRQRYFYNNQECAVVLRSGGEPLIVYLHYITSSLAYDDLCTNVSLCVHGVRFCGWWEVGATYAYILPEYSDFTQARTIFWTKHAANGSGVHSASNCGYQRNLGKVKWPSVDVDNTNLPCGVRSQKNVDTCNRVKVSQELATNQTVEEATGGVGSYKYFVTHSRVTYSPEFRDRYIDRCSTKANHTDYPAISNTTVSDAPQDDVDAALVQAINSLNRARVLLRQRN